MRSPTRPKTKTDPGVTDDGRIVPPGGTIGIVGGGQLGRMAALAAAPLGYRCHIFCPDADSPAEQVADKPKTLGWFVGQVMQKTGGKANPQAVNEILKKEFGL